ncbi:transcription termination/antitermination protein NusG [Mycoplasma leonicaptivi]|uniref:transcription termination/antitermination protein NusG n=1 Tax=Mycoplasma leonicaptivi TaxID=36742 RepID=UPI0004852740|nr:transcription termination/antitermination protein NusG [Mycoplasma leonicaptivi]
MNQIKWYMISTIRGKEEQVVESLTNRIIAENLSHDFDKDATPNGAFKIFKKPTLTQREFQKRNEGLDYTIKYVNLYPGYIFAKMHMSDESWFLIRNTQYVTGLIGSSGKGAKPTPLSNSEIKKMFKQEEEAQKAFDSGENIFGFTKGDVVEILDGIYIGEEGIIKSINFEEKTALLECESYTRKIEVEVALESLKLSE